MRFRRGICFVIAATLVLHAGNPKVFAAQESETRRAVDGNTAFAFDLYGRLKENPGNIFFSPFSISTCLAMTYAGAHGATAAQMAQVLHFPTNTGLLHVCFGQIQHELNARGRNGIELSIANALWAQEGHPFLPAFLSVARRHYEAELKQVDFTVAGDSAALELSEWISTKTKGKIQNMFGLGSLLPDTRLVLANAIYFKGRWAHTFDKSGTATAPFHISSRKAVDVPLMHHLDMVNYVESEAFQAVELPYAGDALSMVILLPRKSGMLSQVEAWLAPTFLSRWVQQMKPIEVEIFLPNFKMEASLELSSKLATMGMPNAFQSQKADFSSIDGVSDLFISGVFHKGWVEVSEEGTEAAAATGIPATASLHTPPPPPVFRADHPFTFMIRDKGSGSFLFLGRLGEPTKSP